MFVSFIRAVILYLLLIVTVRLMGKRQLAELEPSEFVVAILIADLASVPMQDAGIPLLSGIIPILTVLALELILSVLAMRCRTVRRLLSGSPILLMQDGRILAKNLARTRITVDELLQHLREKEIVDLASVQYAILEVDGQISAIIHPKNQPPTAMDTHVEVDAVELPITLISDGKILEDRLQPPLDRTWLERELKRLNCTTEEIFLMTATRGGKIYVSKKEEDGAG